MIKFPFTSFAAALGSLLILISSASATDLIIENVRPVIRPGIDPEPPSVIFDVKWSNSWNNDKNHDAAWIFIKLNNWTSHAKILPAGHRILKNRVNGCPDPIFEVSSDSLGFFIYPGSSYHGDVDLKLKVMLDTSRQAITNRTTTGKFGVYGVEMVYIPEGSFTLGSPDPAAASRAAFYKSNANGLSSGLYKIESEEEISVGPTKGSLYYQSESELYNGDQAGPVPADFPKGYDPFYIMKYELTQGQYAAFLNNLYDNDTYVRSPIGGRNYDHKRGGIKAADGHYIADNPSRPMNYVSFTDGLAFSDWAALRPITELEYEKAARGPAKPIAREFVWGTDNYDQLERHVVGDDLTVLDEALLSDDTRAIFGASYYWVMDLSGSLWEKVITIGNIRGREFEGSHGDGELSFGSATNIDWPTSDNEEGGFGYRGGGYYNPDTGYSDFNPHSPIGYRYYGAWSGGPRYLAYGYRAGRDAMVRP